MQNRKDPTSTLGLASSLLSFPLLSQRRILIAEAADALPRETEWRAEERGYRRAVRDGLEDGAEELQIRGREGEKKGMVHEGRKGHLRL